MPDHPQAKTFAETFFTEMCPLGYALIIAVAAIVVFIGACLVLMRTRGLAPVAAFLPLTTVPLMLGLFAGLARLLDIVGVLLMYQTRFDLFQLIARLGSSAAPLFFGLVSSAPAFFVASLGLLVRSLRNAEPRPAPPNQGVREQDNERLRADR